MFAQLLTGTGDDLSLNVALICPDGTITVAGTVTPARSLNKRIFTPPFGAGPFRLTVPVLPAPPVTDKGFNMIPARFIGVKVRVAFAVLVFNVTEIVAPVGAETAAAVTLNNAEACPG